MIMKKIYFILTLALLLGATSCRDEMPGMQNPSTEKITTWEQLFESYWKGMNNNYVFWDIDPTDWDAVYREYKPKFKSIDIEDEETAEKVTKWIEEMSSQLIDHHLQITIKVLTDENGNPYSFSPGDKKVSEREEYRQNLVPLTKMDVITRLKKEGRLDGSGIMFPPEGSWGDRYYITGLLDNQIAYISFSSFAFLDDLNSENNAKELKPLLDNYYDLLDSYEGLKGVIIDVRGNFGGYLKDLGTVLGKFVSEPLQICSTKMKNGAGRLDYTPRVPEYLMPSGCKRNLGNIPVVVLADMHSISMAEMTTLTVLQLPKGNGVFIGERTFGGTGTINYDFESAYGGLFENEYLQVYTCATNTVYNSGQSYEGKGVPPTIECRLDTDLILQGIDNQLERAVEYIETGK